MRNLRKLQLAKIVDEKNLSTEHKRAIALMSEEEVEALLCMKEQLGGSSASQSRSSRQGWISAF